MAAPTILALDRETLIDRVDAVLSYTRRLYVAQHPEGGDVISGQDALLHDLDALALDLRTLPIEGSER